MHEVETASEAVLKLQVLLDKADGTTPSAIRQMQVLKFTGFTSTKVQNTDAAKKQMAYFKRKRDKQAAELSQLDLQLLQLEKEATLEVIRYFSASKAHSIPQGQEGQGSCATSATSAI